MGWRESIGGAFQAGAGILDAFGDSFTKGALDGDVRTDLAQGDPQSVGEIPSLSGMPAKEPEGIFWDPFAIIEAMGYKERPTTLTYEVLRQIIMQTPILHAIVLNRINQVAAFALPQADPYAMGFQIRPKDPDAEVTFVDKKFIRKWEQGIVNSSFCDAWKGMDNSETFLKKFTRDSFQYDQGCVEVIPDRRGKPATWMAVDGASIRIADSNKSYPEPNDLESTAYVQVYDTQVVAEYNRTEMGFFVRNPRTDLRVHGYGMAEAEMLVRAITALLYAFEYNFRFFSQGSAIKGVLNFKGAIPEKQLKSFRRQWYQMVSGYMNAWRTPILNTSDGLEFVNMHTSNREMEYSAWFDFLIKISCAIYLMDPVEINFKYGNSGQSRQMFEGANKQKLVESKDRGLRPLLRNAANALTKMVLEPHAPDFMVVFSGLESATPTELADLNQKRVTTTHMIDEVRADMGKGPLPNGKGQIILNPVFMQAHMQSAGQMQAQQGMGGVFPGFPNQGQGQHLPSGDGGNSPPTQPNGTGGGGGTGRVPPIKPDSNPVGVSQQTYDPPQSNQTQKSLAFVVEV